MILESRSPTERIHRIGRHPSPWEPPDWSRAYDDGTFGNRFDDPYGHYRVLYASSQRLGCYVETLARFRPDLSMLAELSEIEGDDDFVVLGGVPSEWFAGRRMGGATTAGVYAEIYATGWVSHLREKLSKLAIEFALPEIDTATLQRDIPRAFTQHASYEVWVAGLDGIYYRSRYGHNLENWALFEPFQLSNVTSDPLNLLDQDLGLALEILGLRIVD